MHSNVSKSAVEALESRIAPATLAAVTLNNHLIQFDSSTPGTIDSDIEITGLGTGEVIQGFDARPATGELYLLTTIADGANLAGRIYRLDAGTGVATQVGDTPFSTTISPSTTFGFDFNPRVDLIRIISGADQNFRVNPDTGVPSGTDTNLDDPNSDDDFLTSIAYDRNMPGTEATTLYGIDFNNDLLVRIGGINGNPSPNGGLVTPVGPLGVTLGQATSFDIAIDGTAFIAAQSGTYGLYTVNLQTGAASSIGLIGSGNIPLRGFTVLNPTATISGDGKTASYIDVDGDVVTVKTTKGQFDASDFVISSAGSNGGGRLVQLNLGNDGDEFAGANITFTAKKSPTGDGLVDVGWINSTGQDLGKVSVKGDLSRITAGDGDDARDALGSLTVRTFGSVEACDIPASNKLSVIDGRLGSLKVAGDVTTVNIQPKSFGTIRIGGSLDQALIFTLGNIDRITIGGNVVGSDDGAATYDGRISCVNLKTLQVGGSILGGSNFLSGVIDVGGAIGKGVIGGNVIGGSESTAGAVLAGSVTDKLVVKGSLIGGSDEVTGALRIGTGKSVTVGGDIVGGNISDNASLSLSGVLVGGTMDRVTIGGSVVAGSDNSTGSAFRCGAVIFNQSVGSLTIKGDLVGNENVSVDIIARGQANLSASATEDLAIGKLTIGGSVKDARILAGYENSFDSAVNGNASIGSVKVGGDWVTSSLVAGVRNLGDMANPFDDNTNFGNQSDALINSGNDALIARIASIAIKGRVYGSTDMNERFGFVAEEIGKFSALGLKPKLNATGDDLITLSPLMGAVTLHEV